MPSNPNLEDLVRTKRTSIKVIGAGGAGNNTINRLMDIGVEGADCIAINTDAQDLLYTNAHSKVLIGKEITGGLGAGSDPQVGAEAAKEDEKELKEVLHGADLVFVTCGLGGGTGTGSAPIIAELAKKTKALTIGIVTLPFSIEGAVRWENAQAGLSALRENTDTVIVIPNDKLLEIVPELPLNAAFKVADEILVNAVRGITELVTKEGLVNLDFADIRTIMRDGGTAMIGLGESDTEEKARDAVEKALTNPLLDIDITGAKGALINVIGGSDMTLQDARVVMEAVSDKLDSNARIIWGARIDPDLQNLMRVMLVVTGLKQQKQILGPEGVEEKKVYRSKMEKEYGIEFVG
ncbi:MAG: cell division protein FtsZ [archaeon]